ncbi:methyltransferase type 11 [Candidatus Moduliflexus flocculans]|uniref:Methyltransferase type 11 n=1 Tax=Candidatus Moduliflexus flocculans TaxID=1499966 RepID=A0A0S6VQS3_9BACT|nr:methyltransferase type 11 [Candidatus Moduliflexus flocculans]
MALEHNENKIEEWKANYEWMMLELYDQTVRERSGGEMAAYLSQASVPNVEFVVQRVGYEAKAIMEKAVLKRQGSSTPHPKSKKRERLASWRYWRERLIKKLLGAEYEALKIGRFRQGGEIHQWMYDRYSLRALLEYSGFSHVTPCTATDSAIPRWAEFQLDTDAHGVVYKPDSLFMEAVKA